MLHLVHVANIWGITLQRRCFEILDLFQRFASKMLPTWGSISTFQRCECVCVLCV